MRGAKSKESSYHQIIIIGSNNEDLKLFSSILEPDGYIVTPIDHSEVINHGLANLHPALILLDTKTLRLKSFELCRQLKGQDENMHIPVIFMGATDEKELMIEGFKAGGTDYLSRPFCLEEVLVKVNNHICLYKNYSELKAHNEYLEDKLTRTKKERLNLGKRITALTLPLDDSSDLTIDELFNIDDLQKLQDQFAHAFGIASIITTPDGVPITQPSNFSHLCSQIIRKTEKGLKNCMHSDSIIGCQNLNGPIVMPCLSGSLLDAGASITIGGRHVANWLIGQIRDENTDENKLKEYAREIGADEQVFMNSYYKVTSMPLSQFQKIAEVLFTMAGQLSVISYQNVQQAQYINYRKQAEAAIIESEERFRTILYSIGDGIITTDTQGRVKVMNSLAEELTGWTQSDASGRLLEEVFHIVHEETRAQVEIPVRRVLRERVIVGLANHTVLIAKDGKEYPIADSGAPIRTDKGEIIGVVLVFRDQSVEREAEYALRESEKRFKLLYENAPLSYQSLDNHARLIDVNPTWLHAMGYQREEVIGKSFGDFMTPESAALVQARFANFVSAGEIHNYQFEMVRKDGTTFLVSYDGRIAYDELGQFKRTHCIFTDITQRKKAEEALKESESKFRSLFENSSVGISVTSIDGIMNANKAFMEMLGYKDNELKNINWQELTHPDDIQKNAKVLASLVKGEFDSGRFEKRYIHKNGNIVWADISITLQRDSDNQPAYYISSITDITNRKHVEEAILNEKQLLRTLIDNLPVTIYVKDSAGRKIVANKADLEVIGVSSEIEVLGKTDLEIFNNQIGKRGFEDDLKVIKTGQQVINREEIFFNKDGEQQWLLTSKIPLHDQKGNITGLVGIGQDITEQKKANETILKFSKSIEQSPSTIVITDLYGNIEYVNPKFTEITGYTLEDVIGKNPRILKSGHMPPEVYTELWDTIKSGEVWRGEFLNKRKNGELYWEWATMTSIKNEEGVVTNYISIKEDISSRKKMEADLIVAKNKAEENDRLKSAFLANMSHEIRTPLNSIIGFSELLSDPGFESEQKYEFARIITNSGNNLLAIISDIMDISKIEAGLVEIKKTVFSVSRLIQDIHNEYQIKAHKKGIEFHISNGLLPEDMLIESDQTKIKQVLINFVGNALKFTEKGTIEIGAKVTEQSIQLFVKDTGIGIPEQYHARIFERFRQVEGSYTRKYGGNGLGLAISKSLIEMLGGTIEMQSREGKGSTFYLTLPYDLK